MKVDRESIEEIKARAKSGQYLTQGNTSEADCVIGFSFGYRKHGDVMEPGVSNQDIAEFIADNCPDLPKILQFEIAEALDQTDDVHRISQHRDPQHYLDTREVASQAKQIMVTHGWKYALLVAHPNHMPRVDAICRELGISTIVPNDLGPIRFDPKSSQQQTRNLANWIKHETRAIENDLL